MADLGLQMTGAVPGRSGMVGHAQCFLKLKGEDSLPGRSITYRSRLMQSCGAVGASHASWPLRSLLIPATVGTRFQTLGTVTISRYSTMN